MGRAKNHRSGERSTGKTSPKVRLQRKPSYTAPEAEAIGRGFEVLDAEVASLRERIDTVETNAANEALSWREEMIATDAKLRTAHRSPADPVQVAAEVIAQLKMSDAETAFLRDKLAATESRLKTATDERDKRMQNEKPSTQETVTMSSREVLRTSLPDVDYHARVWRTNLLRPAAAAEVEKLLTAFIPAGFHVDIRRDQPVSEPNGALRTWPVVATLRDRNPDGSDAHIMAYAQTVDGARAKLLGWRRVLPVDVSTVTDRQHRWCIVISIAWFTAGLTGVIVGELKYGWHAPIDHAWYAASYVALVSWVFLGSRLIEKRRQKPSGMGCRQRLSDEDGEL